MDELAKRLKMAHTAYIRAFDIEKEHPGSVADALGRWEALVDQTCAELLALRKEREQLGEIVKRHPLPWQVKFLWPDRLPVLIDSNQNVILEADGPNGYEQDEQVFRWIASAAQYAPPTTSEQLSETEGES